MTVNAGSGSTAETVAFSYGPDRKRWQQMYTGNGTNETTNYVGGFVEVVSSDSVTDYRHYIYAGAEPVAVYSRKTSGVNTFSYLISDHQGSLTAITNSSGTPDVNESFTAFGNRRNALTWSGPNTTGNLTEIAGYTRAGYTFQTALGLWMGMNHMNGRVEEAVTGRMLSADPHVPDRTNTQNYNRYSYANNNPLTYVDPSGFDASCANDKTCKPINPPPGGPDFTGGVSAGMYASMLSSGSYASLIGMGVQYNEANGLTGLGVSNSGSNSTNTSPADNSTASDNASGGSDDVVGVVVVTGHKDGSPTTVEWPSTLANFTTLSADTLSVIAGVYSGPAPLARYSHAVGTGGAVAGAVLAGLQAYNAPDYDAAEDIVLAQIINQVLGWGTATVAAVHGMPEDLPAIPAAAEAATAAYEMTGTGTALAPIVRPSVNTAIQVWFTNPYQSVPPVACSSPITCVNP